MNKVITTDHKVNLSRNFLESVNNGNTYYLCALNHVLANTDVELSSTFRQNFVDVYDNLIFAKKVKNNDVALLIRNVPYQSGRVYEMYDDQVNLKDKDFYCIVDETSFFHVYKCLNNNFRANSTVTPQFAFVDQSNNYTFETADGYVWKYMYSVTDSQKDKFSTDYYFPVIANNEVSANAIKGSIDVIAIDGEGKGYNNYFNGTFLGTDIRIDGDDKLYRVHADNIYYANGYYDGCAIYLSEGTGSGQLRTISSYMSNSSGHYITLDESFTITPVNGTEYQISPGVVIKGTGKNVIEAKARAIVDPLLGNSISKIEMLTIGANYDKATASVIASNIVDVQRNAIIRPIHSPINGHGFDPPEELFCDSLEFSVTFANSEMGLLPIENSYSEIALIHDPLFSNVSIELASSNGSFIIGETIYKLEPFRVATEVSMNTTSNVISGERLFLNEAVLSTIGLTGSYEPSDVLTVVGGEAIIPATIQVLKTQVRSVTINEPGDDQYTNSDIIVIETGNGSPAICALTTHANGVPNILTINDRGSYTSNPDSSNVATSNGSGSGLTVDIEMGVETFEITNPGSYASLPTNFANNVPTGGSGTGAEFILTFQTNTTNDFTDQFKIGDDIYITNNNDTERQLAVIENVVNSTAMIISSNGLFACTDCKLYIPNKSNPSIVKDVSNSTNIFVSGLHNDYVTNDLIVGESSRAKLTVNSISINDVSKNLDTLNGMYKYEISVFSGEFIEDEQIYEGSSLSNSTSNAHLHSVKTIGGQQFIFCTRQNGFFEETIIGNESGAIANVVTSYIPEIEFLSGSVLYHERHDVIERNETQSENFKVIIRT